MTETNQQNQIDQWMLCSTSPIYFTHNYVSIYEASSGSWIPFKLWPEQASTLTLLNNSQLTIILKARQLGCTWLCLAYALWMMLFRPAADVLLFSRRDDEAVHLLDERLKGMYRRLPEWMRARRTPVNNNHMFSLSNGSIARAFPTNAGDSYTAGLAIVDEADLVPDLNRLLRSVKPTIDTGGKMVLLSRADKETPQSEFKRIFRSSQQGAGPWANVFLPWYVRPERDMDWYQEQKEDVLARTGTLDDLYEQYPATVDEALALKEMDRRIPTEWLRAVYVPIPSPCETAAEVAELLAPENLAGRDREALADYTASRESVSSSSWQNHVRLYKPPAAGHIYVMGADPAEGNPTSDDSCAHVLDLITGEEVLILVGKIQPEQFAQYVYDIGQIYFNASVLCERNNHGHACIQKFRQLGQPLLSGTDQKPGWLTTKLSKALLYNTAVEYIRVQDAQIHDSDTFYQLSSLSGETLSAPKDEKDDFAVSFALGLMARSLRAQATPVFVMAGNELYRTQERARERIR